ncbi:MAG: hypothetical protein CL608_16785 [Anaerolineaceae bacterium]|nr:hypothetical protein [Anaerolineaceae bacterium]
MNRIKLTIWPMLFLILVGFADVKLFARDHAHNIEAMTQAVSSWIQVNNNGFGNQQTEEVSALEAFNNHLYAGTSNLIDGAQIFRSTDGVTWTAVTDPGFGSAHDTAPPAILDMMVFDGYLYATTGRGNAAQIWRTVDGVNWARVVNAGFGDPDVVNMTVLAVYGSQLYVGAAKQDTGVQVWRTYTGDGNLSNWNQVATGTDPAIMTGLSVFNVDGGLYAAVQSETGAAAQIWRSYGGALGTWTAVVSDGFGNNNTTLTGGLAEFNGYLYVGAGNIVDGAQLWRSNDGVSWQQMITPGLGDPNSEKVESVFIFQNQLYVGVKNVSTGIEIWRLADGLAWEQANLDGFGDGNNAGTNGHNATAEFLNQLYLGTANAVDGGELWRKPLTLNERVYLPVVLRMP